MFQFLTLKQTNLTAILDTKIHEHLVDLLEMLKMLHQDIKQVASTKFMVVSEKLTKILCFMMSNKSVIRDLKSVDSIQKLISVVISSKEPIQETFHVKREFVIFCNRCTNLK